MCLAIYKPARVEIKKKYLENGFRSNLDGAGFCYIENGRIRIEKGFFNFADFWAAYSKIPKKSPMLIHFRLATHGAKDIDNCHPFLILNGTCAVIHNGILPYESTAKKSDTSMFCEGILDPLFRRNNPEERHIKYLVEETIGKGNKIACLFSSGRRVIFHEKEGCWHKGVWFSNKSYSYGSAYSGFSPAWFKDNRIAQDDDYLCYEDYIHPSMRDRGGFTASGAVPVDLVACKACGHYNRSTAAEYCLNCYAPTDPKELEDHLNMIRAA